MSDFHRYVRDLIRLAPPPAGLARRRLPRLPRPRRQPHRWVPGEGRAVAIVANLSEQTHYTSKGFCIAGNSLQRKEDRLCQILHINIC